MKTLLTAVQGTTELLRDDGAEPGAAMSPAERGRFLESISADTGRLPALLVRLRELARTERPMLGGHTIFDDVVAGLQDRFPQMAIRSEGDTPRHRPFQGDGRHRHRPSRRQRLAKEQVR